MDDLNFGLLNTKFGEQIGAALDPAVAQERNNRLADMAVARQYQNLQLQDAVQARAEKMKTAGIRDKAISELSPIYQQLSALGVPADKLSERMANDQAAADYADRQKGVVEPLEYNPTQVMDSVMAIPESPERQQTIDAMKEAGFGVQQRRPLTPEEQMQSDYAYSASGTPGAKAVMGVREFREKQAAARQAQIDKIEAARQSQLDKFEESRAADARSNAQAMAISRIGNGAGAAITPVTVQDPDNQNSTIIIDGRTGRKLGVGPKLTQTGASNMKQQSGMQGLGSDLQQAEDLLMGVSRDSQGNPVQGNKPTASGIGSMYDTAAGFFGATPAGAAESDQLKVVAGRLIMKVPRFEGPQSDKDTAVYRQASGDAGNASLPLNRRLASIQTMRQLYQGYENGDKGRLLQNSIMGNQQPANNSVITHPDHPGFSIAR